jgi:hypothetical protein
MNKIVKIEPIQIPGKGIGEILDIKLDRYDLFGTELRGLCYILNINKKLLRESSFALPKSILDNWGTDDTYIVESVADFMNVTITSIQ